jgi:hypothetical protein
MAKRGYIWAMTSESGIPWRDQVHLEEPSEQTLSCYPFRLSSHLARFVGIILRGGAVWVTEAEADRLPIDRQQRTETFF